MASGFTYEIRLKDLMTSGFQKATTSSTNFHSKVVQGQKNIQANFKRTPTYITKISTKLSTFAQKVKTSFSAAQVRRFNNESRKTSGILGKVGIGIASYIGVSSAITLASNSLRKFDEQSKSDAQLLSVLASTGSAAGRSFEQLAAQADVLQGKTLFGDEATQQVQSMLLTFKNVRTEMFDKSIPAILDMATAMKVDGKSAALQLGKALNDPAKGLSMLSRSGITFSKAQETQIKALQKSGQIAKAQAVILKEVNSQFKGSAEAAARSGTGKWTQFMNVVGDLQEVLGEKINTIRNRIVAFFTKIIENSRPIVSAWNRIKEAITPLFTAVGTFIGAMGLFSATTDTAGNTVNIFSGILNTVANVFAVVSNGVQTLLKILGPLAPVIKIITGAIIVFKIAFALLNFVMNLNPIFAIVTGIVLLIGIVVTAYKKIGWFRGAIKGAWEGLKAFGKVIKDNILDSFKRLLSGITGIGKAFKHLFSGEWKKAWEVGKTSVSNLGKGLTGITPVGMVSAAIKNGKTIGKATQKGYAKGIAEIEAKKKKKSTIKSGAPVAIVGTKKGYAKGIAEIETKKKKKSTIKSGVPVAMLDTAIKNRKTIGASTQKGYAKGIADIETKKKKKSTVKSGVPDVSHNNSIPYTGITAAKSTAESIATGGKKQTILNVHIEKVLEMGDQIITEGTQDANEIVDTVIEGLTRRLNGTFRSTSA